MVIANWHRGDPDFVGVVCVDGKFQPGFVKWWITHEEQYKLPHMKFIRVDDDSYVAN
jgi:hypothetical protein